tara:strand:- start:3453 stop:4187 length:735 start_codon:yes stop_codon:yes gene_type:complete
MSQNLLSTNRAFDFNITNYCNAGCPTCKRYTRPNNPYEENVIKPFLQQNKIHMNFSDYKKIILFNEEMFAGKDAQFCGEFGDPFMHPKIEDFTLFSCEIFDLLRINTNAGFNRKKYLKNVAHLKDKICIHFSIDGMTHETNNVYRVGVNTDLAFENMIYWNELTRESRVRTSVAWDFVVFQHNLEDVEEVVDFAMKNEIFLTLKINLRKSYRNILKITKEQYEEVRKVVMKKNYKNMIFQDYYE